MCNELKAIWKHQEVALHKQDYDLLSFEKLIKSRMRKHTSKVMTYFWSSFTLEMGVFALLCHVMIRYWHESPLFVISLIGVLLHLPFTYMLMRKFKAMAVTRPVDSSATSLYLYIKRRHDLLSTFYAFKRRYEVFLIPISILIGCYLVFELYIPGEGFGYWNTFWILVVTTIISCAFALRRENKDHFEEPLSQYRLLLDEFEERDKNGSL
jgi:hypothetical protein